MKNIKHCIVVRKTILLYHHHTRSVFTGILGTARLFTESRLSYSDLTHTHTHTHTHTDTHTQAHTQTHTHTRMHTHNV